MVEWRKVLGGRTVTVETQYLDYVGGGIGDEHNPSGGEELPMRL